MDQHEFTVGILGLGQIGGSLAAALRSNLPQLTICGYDVDISLTETARSRGYLNSVAESERALIGVSNVVVISIPMTNILESLQKNADLYPRCRAVTDTGSLKAPIMEAAASLNLTNFVGGHPLAGTEKRGLDSWNGQLFRGRRYFLIKNSHTPSEALEAVTQLVVAIGATPIQIEATAHDSAFASAISLPHVFAYVLRHMAGDCDSSSLQGPSFESATRVAASNPETVIQMLWHNRCDLSPRISDLISQLDIARQSLNSGNEAEFRKFFESILAESRRK